MENRQENIRNNPPDRFNEMAEKDKKIAVQWLDGNIQPRKTPLPDWSSYGIKHLLERDTKLYMTNGEFKGAMLQCGYKPVDAYELNWYFCISKRSPALKYKRRKVSSQ